MPSKKFIIVALIILLSGAGIFWLFRGEKLENGNRIFFQKQEGFVSSIFQQNKKDSDNDGLTDWEEVLWKTDPNNPDTDKDGTLDGEEIKLGRNPLKPGPDDLYSPEKFSEATTTDTEQITETEKFSRNFLSQYLNLKLQSGGEEMDETTKQRLINSLLEDINFDIQGNAYTISDIKTSSDNSQRAIRDYGNQLGSIIKKYGEPAQEPELMVLKRAVESQNEAELENLNSNINGYDNMAKDSANLTVPSSAKELHLNLANSFASLKRIIAGFQNFFQDPITGFVAVNEYEGAGKEMFDSLVALKNYFRDKGVYFNKDEPGYFIQNI